MTIYYRSHKPVLQPLVEPRQYAWFAHAEHLARAGIAASIGSVGDAYVNALME
jgi:putative transposase